MPHQLPRHSLLPDLERSRAVLVACGGGGRWGPEDATRQLAEALTSADTGRPFHRWHTEVLIDPTNPAEVLDAVVRAADEASDVLLFHYVGRGDRHERFVAHELAAVAELLSRSNAVRPVVILDTEEGSAAWSCFTRKTLPWHDIMHPISLTLMALTRDSGDAAGHPFPIVLARAVTDGIIDGAEVPELADLKEAIDIHYLDHALGAATESYAPPQGGVVLRRGYKAPKLALSVNPSAAPPYRPGALTIDVDAIYDYHWG